MAKGRAYFVIYGAKAMQPRALGRREVRFAAACDAAADWMNFVAAPAFALMAVLAAMSGSHDVLCSVSSRPMNAMAWMYALMSIRHSTPWLKLLSGVSTNRR